jgi:hypothetical protein
MKKVANLTDEELTRALAYVGLVLVALDRLYPPKKDMV